MPGRDAKFNLDVPLDISQVAGEDAQELRVLARTRDGSVSSTTVKAQPGQSASVTIPFAESPGPLQLLVGPASASESDLLSLQTISVDVRGQRWGEEHSITVDPVVIASYYWWWWRDWCRNFVVRGRVVCADGSPVPGATVCAYDVDWWFWWTSTQQLGCATTDLNGAFELDFSWCCGWWPWLWWRDRVWDIDPVLVERIGATLEQDPRIKLGRVTTQPSLSVFSELLGPAAAIGGPLTATDADQLEQLRASIAGKLPSSAELSGLGVWPWRPWRPWWDCGADVIFKVTQDCRTPGTVVLAEGIEQARVNIAQSTQVTLIANELACCRRSCPQPCAEGECIDIADVCEAPINRVGGNVGAPVSPVGYLNPGAVAPGTSSAGGDQAFAGVVTISNANIVTGVDYYEIQYYDGSNWVGLPPGVAQDFHREWVQPFPLPGTSGAVPFQFTNKLVKGGKGEEVSVVETREHYEASPGLPTGAYWTSNQFLVVALDSANLPEENETYEFRVVGWRDAGAGKVEARKVLPVCDPEGEEDNGWVLTFNNRVEPNPAAGKPCGPGSTHLCVTEPDTRIIAVRVDGEEVPRCGTVDASSSLLEVEFLAQDLSGNLGSYSLKTVFGESEGEDLVSHGTLTLVSGDAPGPTYGQALAHGASAPVWKGGTMLLSVLASVAFPEPCCYDLELEAWSRTVVDCEVAYWNRSDFTIGVGVCPPAVREVAAEDLLADEHRVKS